MIKILMITESMASGVMQIIMDISNHLSNDTLEISVVYSRRAETPSYEQLRSLFSEQIQLIEIPASREINIKHDVKTMIQYYKKIKEIDPDIIHLHSTKAGVLGRIAAFLCGKRNVFYSPHGFSFLRQDISKNKKTFFKKIEQIMGFFPNDIICVSETEKNIASTIINPKKIIHINNGIHTLHLDKVLSNQLKNSELEEFCRDAVVIGSVGRLSYQKNPLFALDFIKELKLKSTIQVKFVWIGGGELEEEIKGKIKENKLEDDIYLTGWLTREEAVQYVNTYIDIYVQFSLWEGMPVSLLEAMYMKKAIVATNVIGNKDVIIHDFNGQLISNLEEAVNSTLKYINQKEIANSYSSKAKNYVIESFNIHHMVESYRNVYYKKYKVEKKTNGI